MFAITQLAQTVTRSAIGKLPLDKTFMERDTLNANIVVCFYCSLRCYEYTHSLQDTLLTINIFNYVLIKIIKL